MNNRLIAIENWKIAEDAAKKAVESYRNKEKEDLAATQKAEIRKQILILLGIAVALAYAYAQTRGIRF